jgi:hypothetical protein
MINGQKHQRGKKKGRPKKDQKMFNPEESKKKKKKASPLMVGSYLT